jgi:hypothetical protein
MTFDSVLLCRSASWTYGSIMGLRRKTFVDNLLGLFEKGLLYDQYVGLGGPKTWQNGISSWSRQLP